MAAAVQSTPQMPTLDAASAPTHATHYNCSDAPPSDETLRQCAQFQVYDADKNVHSFKSLYENRRCMVVFVRHFFCGLCQNYLNALTAAVSPKSLTAAEQPTSLVVIGCGQPEAIRDYASNTGCTFPIYADPDRKLYDALGLKASLDLGNRPKYQSGGTAVNAIRSIIQGLSSGANAFRGGNFSQLGGEFLFEENRVAWCHTMRNTRDHTEIDELKAVLGV